MNKSNRWTKAFDIFGQHGLTDYDVEAQHDIIYVSCPQLLSTSVDGQALRALGWGKDEEFQDLDDREEGKEYADRDEDAAWFHYT